jgi:CubicO group peptidase (beta-lactamase class C family)
MLCSVSLDTRDHLTRKIGRIRRSAPLWVAFLIVICVAADLSAQTRFPAKRWATKSPEDLHVDEASLVEVAELLGGRGCIVKYGFVVHAWGDQAKRSDWMSSAKPVISTLLFFALQEGLVESVDQGICEFEDRLVGKDRDITFRHLGSMSSGYLRSESPGQAWAYNDYSIQLYQKTLFDRVFKQDPHDVAEHPERLGALGLEDHLKWREGKRRLSASVRDFARIAWFWLNRGKWQDRQLLPESYFDDHVRPQTPKDLPHTAKTEQADEYLGIGSYGGGSDHFTKYGAGIYGFNWWFNNTGRLHPTSRTWPDAPADTYMSIGARGNCAVIYPSLNMVLVCAEGNWGKLEAGNAKSRMNRILALTAWAAGYDRTAPRVSGELTKWRPVSIDFRGPNASASDLNPNPFLDYRLQVQFTGPSGKSHDVPGFFAGDGSSGLTGDVWRVVFSPDETGTWQYRAMFRQGNEAATRLDLSYGEPLAFDGSEGRIEIAETSPTSTGFYRWGRLEYVGGHYLKLRDGPYWLKGGADSPEDFLAYKGFANTPKARHQYANHVADWREGDPEWDGGKGKGIIGALNYLAAQQVNSIYFLPMNIGGDGKNVYPYLGKPNAKGSPENDNLHFDLTKLEQWSLVFEHAQRQGIMLHVVLNEAEAANKKELDGGQLGVERKLFYRELIARFGHFPALQWNISEEYNLHHKIDPETVKEFAQYIADTDPDDHPITVHHSSRAEKAWAPFVGNANFTVTSFQENKDVSKLVESWREKSRQAGVPLVIGVDESFPDKTSPTNIDRHRKEYIWNVYFSGGQIELILDELLKVEDFRRYEAAWQYMAYARNFMNEHLPFWEMEPADGLLQGESEFKGKNNLVGGQVLAKQGEAYAIYLAIAVETGKLDLQEFPARFRQRWFNPRAGTFAGPEVYVQGGRQISLGTPPTDPSEDWVVLLTRENR